MRRTWLSITILAGLLLANLAGTPSAEEIFQQITIQPGDTMWSIANKYLKDPHRWPDIVKYNQLPTSDPTVDLTRVPLELGRVAGLVQHVRDRLDELGAAPAFRVAPALLGPLTDLPELRRAVIFD